MKKVQPEVKKLQERHKDDQMACSTEMMELYKKEKINPLSGCWPIMIQIPVFFALYKVLFDLHRNAPCAVLRLDPGSVGARSDLIVQPVRPACPMTCRVILMSVCGRCSWASPCSCRCR